MKSKIYIITALIASGLFFQSCNNSNVPHKNITGKAYELIVVISNASWNGVPGKMIQETLGQPHVALPQEEPIFNLVNVPPDAFKSIFKSTRNILMVTISSTTPEPQVIFKDDIWAYPQATVQINVKNKDEFVKVFNENKNKIMSYFLAAERERLTMNYNKYYEKSVYNVLSKDFGVTMKVPPGFQIASQKKDFIWFRYETPDISQGIVLYTFPYTSDSTFTIDYLVSKRDSILKANVPGPTDGSYMATEKRFDQVFNVAKHNGNYASQMRGLWRVMNDFMGGPYFSLAELDTKNQRVVVAFGYVYAPSKNKRNFINQVEAMIYSLKFNDQNVDSKLNGELEVGD